MPRKGGRLQKLIRKEGLEPRGQSMLSQLLPVAAAFSKQTMAAPADETSK